jgi:hypothetical protein
MGVGCILSPLTYAATAVGKATLGDLFDTLTSWVSGSVDWLLHAVGAVVGSTSDAATVVRGASPEFTSLIPLAAPLMLVGLLVSVLAGLRHGDTGALVRTVAVALPVAVASIALTRPLAELVLRAVDQMSATAAAQVSQRAGELGAHLSTLAGTVPGFGLFLMAGLVVVGAIALWCELVVRAVALAVLVAFAPVVMALSVFPSLRRAGWRLAETFCAVAASKFAVVVVLALGLDLMTGRGAAAVVAGAVTLLLATVAPVLLLRVVPILESSALHQLDGVRQRLSRSAQAAATSPVARAAGGLLPEPPLPEPPEDPEDLGIPMAESDGDLPLPPRGGTPPPPPIIVPPPRRGHVVIKRDRMGPVVGWQWDDE